MIEHVTASPGFMFNINFGGRTDNFPSVGPKPARPLNSEQKTRGKTSPQKQKRKYCTYCTIEHNITGWGS
jgi:hypothetical protein